MAYTLQEEEQLANYEVEIGLAALKEEAKKQYWNNHRGCPEGGEEYKGKYWLALSPHWLTKGDKKRFKTEYKILYWVNYGDDETYGWFTVEQIKQWLTTPGLLLYTLGGNRERIIHNDKA